MKVFIRSSELANSKRPEIIAFYDDAVEIPANAHGAGVTVITVPPHTIVHEKHENNITVPLPARLAENWREQAGSFVAEMEGKRRINEAFSPSDQINALHEILTLILQHGGNLAEWPASAKERVAEIDEKWNYVGEIRERARALKSVPLDPTSDKVWPTRIKK